METGPEDRHSSVAEIGGTHGLSSADRRGAKVPCFASLFHASNFFPFDFFKINSAVGKAAAARAESCEVNAIDFAKQPPQLEALVNSRNSEVGMNLHAPVMGVRRA